VKLLLDTHTFIWWDSDLFQLSNTALDLLINPENTLILSVGSIWEIQIKRQLGKLTLRSSLIEIVAHQQTTNRIIILPISLEHAIALEQLPLIHKDPFDRILISQAIHENAILISADSVFSSYTVQCIW
jgi:PIN domain nuclease of toxin-antitoxin system